MSTESPYLSGAREQWALAEVARTRITRRTGWILTSAFLATLVAIPAAEVYVGEPRPALREIPSIGELLSTGRAEGPLSANRRLLRSMQAVEDSLETDSVLSRALLPTVQLAATAWLGQGNEQAIPGRDRWLFFRPDLEHLTGAPFLDPAVLERRRRAGDPGEPAIQPDPLIAIEALASRLRERGIALVLLPAPVKPMLLPERLTGRGEGLAVPVHNPSWPDFTSRAQRLGAQVVDVAAALATHKARGDDEIFLRTDTHWTPQAMEAAAEVLAAAVRPHLDPAGTVVEWTRRDLVVESRGDTVALLNLPRDQRLFMPQSVRLQRVSGPGGAPWTPDPSSEVLLLGDSFTNIFSDASLQWGQGAGLAEQLSFLLRRPVDRLADNGGGAHGSRVRLAQDLARGVDRLRGKRVVVYEFAMRELTSGDWKRADLPQRRVP